MGSNPTPSASRLIPPKASRAAEILLRHRGAGSPLRLDRLEAAQHFGKQEFIFQVHPVIEVGAQPVLLALAILRHDDDGRLKADDHPQDKI